MYLSYAYKKGALLFSITYVQICLL